MDKKGLAVLDAAMDEAATRFNAAMEREFGAGAADRMQSINEDEKILKELLADADEWARGMRRIEFIEDDAMV